MRGIFLILFVITTPLVLFLTTILYGGFTTVSLKQDLAKAHIYTKMSDYATNLDVDQSDPTTAQFMSVIKNQFNAAYLQTKTEDALDTSSAWISGTTTIPPTLSFKEIKDAITTQYPDLLPTLENMQKDIQNQPVDKSNPDAMQQQEQMNKAFAGISTLTKSDFSLKLDTYLQGVKQFYSFVKIAQPVLLILLLIYITLIVFLSPTIKSKLQWLGWTFLISGIWGFVILVSAQFLAKLISTILLGNTNEMAQLITPIASEIINRLTDTYVTYQGISSVLLFIIAAGCFIAASVVKGNTQPVPAKTSKKK